MNNPQPPIADKIPKELEIHNDKRIDNYFWMKERDSDKVLKYIEAENAYTDQVTAPTKKFQKKLFEELKSRIKEDDSSVPFKLNGYWYITRFETGKEYPIYLRRKETLEAPDELLFDCNKMAEGHAFFNLGSYSVSPDNRYASFTIDTIGRRIYTLQIKDLKTGKTLSDKITDVTPESTWSNDNKTLFYTRKDAVTLRSNKIFKYVLGQADEHLVFEEKDEKYSVFVSKTKSKKYLIIGSFSTLTSEYQILEADNPEGKFRVFQPRTDGIEYSIYHFEDYFYIVTNADGAINFKLVKTPKDNTSKKYWTNVIDHREDTLLEGIDIFKHYLVVSERHAGLNKINIIRWDNKDAYYLPFNSETYTAYTTSNLEFDTHILRYGYSALDTPNSIIDFDMSNKEKEVKKETEVLGGSFDKNNYASERLWAKATDGADIPISVVYRKGLKKDGKSPLLLYGYGSYGYTIDPYFSSTRLSLLDRGVIFAIAHVRGGEYLGRQWYEKGKLLNKRNTFTDFIDCTKYLIAEEYTSPEHCYAMGGSAGGLLMGAIVNLAPKLYNGVIAEVPFVDVLTTMLDDTIPLTTGEYDEWGNPNDKVYYDYMKSYSPYDNVKRQDYPNMLVLTGYHDSQVQYWEPTKWVAKLREFKTDDNILLFHTDVDSGHSGASGRYKSLEEIAERFSFILNLENILD